jgi:aminodeoxyfutalosine deaminase
MMKDDPLYRALCVVPKAEPHAHLEGTLSHARLTELASKHAVSLTEGVRRRGGPCVAPPPGIETGSYRFQHFNDFVGLFLKAVEVIRGPEDLVRVGLDYLDGALAQGITSSELLFSPLNFVRQGLAVEALFEALVEIQDASDRRNSPVLWAFDIPRNASPDGMETVDHAVAARARGVRVRTVGLGGYEATSPAKRFRRAFARAREQGFCCSAHAGETAGPDAIWQTLEELQPARLGHALQAAGDPALLRAIADRGVTVEVCPWSNIALQLASPQCHPLRLLVDAGVPVVLGSDDPGLFGKDLVDNYVLAHQLGVGWDELERIAQRSRDRAR